MKHLRAGTKSLGFKIVIYTLICVLVVGFCGNIYLYTAFNNVLRQKAQRLDEMSLNTAKIQLDNAFSELLNMGITCAGNYRVTNAMKQTSLLEPQAAALCVQAQTVLNDILSSSSFSAYVTKMFIFNEAGLMIQSNSRAGDLGDIALVRAGSLYQNRGLAGKRPTFVLTDSIVPRSSYGYPYEDCLAVLIPVNMPAFSQSAYIYMEVGLALLQDLLVGYDQLGPVFIGAHTGDRFTPLPQSPHSAQLLSVLEQSASAGESFPVVDGERYKLSCMPVTATKIALWSCNDVSNLTMDTRDITYTLAIVLCTSVLVALGVSILSSRYLTSPVRRLIDRIRKISENDFSYDPSIETSQDEIGQIGRVVNEMVLSVNHLIQENEASVLERQKIEMAMLQAQVNPHFLYNTLDSIHWMAVLQKNQGIARITRSLENLLRNMAKGVGNKIPLREELSLLQDYITIQSVRFSGVFEFSQQVSPELLDCAIVKMTLQPIVENAIVHGVGCCERFGAITLTGHAEGGYLYLVVEDNGAGMPPQQVAGLLRGEIKDTDGRLSGIGMANVNKRLRLVYGADCGLSVESREGMFTRVTVKIRKEEVSE